MPDNRKPLKHGAFPVCRNYTVRAHLRHAVSEKRRGRKDPVRCPGPLLSRIHPQHLHPRHGRDETGCGGYHRKRHQPGNVRCVKKATVTCTSQKLEKAAKISTGRGKSCPVLSNPFRSFPLMGHSLGQRKKQKIHPNIFTRKQKKSS